jgi:integrase
MRWAWNHELIERLPLRGLEKPRPTRRETTISTEQWAKILVATDDVFRPMLEFCRAVGCRPQEAREIAAAHLCHDNRLAIFDTIDSKGQRKRRVLYLPKSVRELINSRVKQFPNGPLFRNRFGKPWTANALRCRLRRLRDAAGMTRLFPYQIRHTWETEALLRLPVQLVAELAGHDPSTAMKHYGHLSGKIAEMLDAADKAAS